MAVRQRMKMTIGANSIFAIYINVVDTFTGTKVLIL